MPELRDATVTIGIPGLNGDVTGGATLTDHETRLDALEALGIPTVITDLTDVDLTGAVAGDHLVFDGTDVVPETPSAITVTSGIPVVIDGGGSAIVAGQIIGEIEVPYAGTITGWTVASKTSGSIVCTVSKATYSAFPTYTAISGTEKPTLASTTKNQDLSLTTWTTAVAAGDMLQVEVDSATTVTRVTVNIRISREVGP